jgi:WD40 repeat protein
LGWTSDGKKLISGSSSYGPIKIFDTATWKQIAVLEGHKHYVNAISLWIVVPMTKQHAYGISTPTSQSDHPSTMNRIRAL